LEGELVNGPGVALAGWLYTYSSPQERFQVKNPPAAYIQKLKSYLDTGGVSRKVAADWMSNLGVYVSPFILSLSLVPSKPWAAGGTWACESACMCKCVSVCVSVYLSGTESALGEHFHSLFVLLCAYMHILVCTCSMCTFHVHT
jgi:hypothetical protein